MSERPDRVKMARPGEPEAVKTTIVGGRPPAGGANVGDVPRGVEILVKKAAVDPTFRKALLSKRAGAAEDIALTLSPAEQAILDAVPEAQLRAIIANTKVSPSLRPAFLGCAAAAMLAAVGAATYAEDPDEWEMRTTGIDAEMPPKTEPAENTVLPDGTGIIEGLVYDQNKDPISGTTVKVAHTEFEVTTGSDGKFRIIGVPVGKYDIKASRVGFSSAKRTNIEVKEGSVSVATFMLQSLPAGGTYHDRP